MEPPSVVSGLPVTVETEDDPKGARDDLVATRIGKSGPSGRVARGQLTSIARRRNATNQISTLNNSQVMRPAVAATTPRAEDAAHRRGRLAAARDAMGAFVGAVLGLLPHVLHRISIPLLLLVYRRFHTWRAPAIAVVVFAVVFSLSAFVSGRQSPGARVTSHRPPARSTPDITADNHSTCCLPWSRYIGRIDDIDLLSRGPGLGGGHGGCDRAAGLPGQVCLIGEPRSPGAFVAYHPGHDGSAGDADRRVPAASRARLAAAA